MLENALSNKFNHLFCKYRIKNYVNKTSDYLTRHKLLLAFIICLLVPGIENLPKIGVPFFAIVDSTTSIPLKLFYIGSILVVSMMLTNAQANFIKGGPLRDYLTSFDIAIDVHKKIDFIVLALSINLIWLPIALGAGFIYTASTNAWMGLSLSCLYASFIANYLVLLLNNLYGNRKNMLLLLLNLMAIAFISSSAMTLIHFAGAVLSSLFSVMLFWKTEPADKITKTVQLAKKQYKKQSSNSLKRNFIIQYAVYKQHKRIFLTRILTSGLISPFLIYLTAVEHFSRDKSGFFITLSGLNTYTLSTLFSVFQQAENQYQLFHTLFPYQNQFKHTKEIILTFALLMISALPFLIYLALDQTNLFMVIFMVFLTSFIPLAINRSLYKYSLRFCLLASLINCVAWGIAQYWILGGIFEQ
ncbi:hypothetical protein ACFORL_08160 [Legionella dresdenensis]|uniref:Transmembrane protein n=1 Tax=Legionella dresdenensis TaxID=450200 RepID=A0ABV8CFN1_9GAMM